MQSLTFTIAFLALTQNPLPPVTLHGTDDPLLKGEISTFVKVGVQTVEKFFGMSYRKPFTVDVYATRSGLDAAMKAKWNSPPTERWMVAAGSSSGLMMLSPKAWITEATEHNGNDKREVQEIITHELTHVYHGQSCLKPEFDGMDDMAWYIEGLATYVAGQLGGSRLTALQAINAGQDPKKLSQAWTGNYRYGVSGSIVKYIDITYGRAALIALLQATKTADALKMLKTTETNLLKGWKAFVLRKG